MTEEAARTAETRVGFFALMRTRDYALLWSGQLVSKFGDWINLTALLWWVLQRTHSVLALAVVQSAATAGLLLAGPVAGVLADRIPRRRILIAADVIRAALVVLIPLALSTGVAVVAALVFVIALASAFFTAALFAAIPDLVPRRALAAANSYYTTMDSITDVGGLLVGGAILAAVGPAIVFYIDGGTYLVSLATVLLLWLPRVAAAPLPAISAASVWRDIVDGARYVRRHPALWAVVLVIGAMAATYGLDSLLTTLAQQTFRTDERTYGALLAAAPAGMFAASFLLPLLPVRGPRVGLAALATVARSALLVALAFAPNVWVALPLVFLGGAAFSAWIVSSRTEMMEQAAPEMRGRALAFITVVSRAVPLVAAVAYGRLADTAGVRTAIAAMGGVGIVLTVGIALAARGIVGRARRAAAQALVGRVSDQFDPGQQRVLNVVLGAAVLGVWLRLAVEWPLHAAGLAVAVLAGYAAATLGRGGR